MHSLWVTPHFTPFLSGAQAFQAAMAQRLVADGHRVTLLTTNAQVVDDFWRPPDRGLQPLQSQEIVGGVQIERFPLVYPWPAPYAFGLLRRAGLLLHLCGLPGGFVRPAQQILARWMPPLRGLTEALERWAPDVDLIHSDDSSWDGLLVAAASAAQRYKKPLVVRPLMHLGDAWVRAHYQMAHQLSIYRQATAIVALSSLEADAFVSLGIPLQRIHVISMGVDPQSSMSLADLDIAGFRREHSVGGPIVAFLGANTDDKGAFALAQAVLRLNLEGLPLDLVSAGSQPELLKGFLQRLPLHLRTLAENRVHVLGIVDEMTKQCLLAACDLLALPSQVDTFGIVFLEAWAHGKPVIGARAGGIPDLVRHEETGLLVPFGDVAALAAAIRRLLEEPGLGARLGTAGSQQVRQHYTWDQTYADLLKVYDRVLSNHPQGQ